MLMLLRENPRKLTVEDNLKGDPSKEKKAYK